MQRHSTKRRHLNIMREVFESLNACPIDQRKNLGRSLNYSDYDFAIELIDKEVEKLDKALARVKGVRS